jgi:uncharacterized membrane protein
LLRRQNNTHCNCIICLVAAVGLFVWIVGCHLCEEYDRYAIGGFDLGIFDQAIWLISRGYPAFVSLRGMHILGDHFSMILYLFAPFYIVYADPRWLLLIQTVIVALGAFPIYAVALRHTNSPVAALLFGFLYLINPFVCWGAYTEFHPDNLAFSLLIYAIDMWHRQKWPAYIAAIVLVSLLKESLGLSIFSLGLCQAAYGIRHQRVALTEVDLLEARNQARAGRLTAGYGALISVVALVVIAMFNDRHLSAYFILFRPENENNGLSYKLSQILADPIQWQYVFALFQPFFFLSLLAPDFTVAAALAIAINLLSYRMVMHDPGVSGYYSSSIIPILLYAAIIGYARLARRLHRTYRICLLVNLSLWGLSSLYWSPGVYTAPFFYQQASHDECAELATIKNMIPPDASISVQGSLGAHFSHRRLAYLYPNPFCERAWGNAPEVLSDIDHNVVEPDFVAHLRRGLASAPVEYLVLWPNIKVQPLPDDDPDYFLVALLCPRYGVVYAGKHCVLLQRGASYKAGLRRLAAAVGLRELIATPQNVVTIWLLQADPGMRQYHD